MKKRSSLILVILFAVSCLVFSQEPDKIRVEDILNMSLDDILNVEVTSVSKIPQKLREVPAIVRVITAGQIKERGYFVLEEALADLPGFNFRNILGFNSYSFMRGAPNQNNLILLLIDGYFTFNNLSAGITYLDKQSSGTTNYQSIDNKYFDKGTLWDIHFTVNNLLDTKYFHTSNRPPSRYRQPQRRILIRLNYSF